MKKLAFLLGIGFLILLIGQAKGYTQDYYVNRTSGAASFSYTINNSISDGANNCITTLGYYVDIKDNSGIPYNYLFTLYVNGISNLSTSLTSSANESCFFLGSRTFTNSTYKNATVAFQSFSGGGLPITLRLETHTFCDSNDTYVVFDSGKLDNTTLGTGGYQHPEAPNNDAFPATNFPYGHCNGETPANVGWSATFGCSSCNVVQYVYPFFSGNGSVNINVTDRGGCGGGNPNMDCVIYNTATNTSSALYSCGSSSSQQNFSLSLQPLATYKMICSYTLDNPASNPWIMNAPIFYMNISDITPNYICNTTTCINGSATRTCVDSKGLFPDTITPISCLLANQTVYLGFEDSAPRLTTECIVGSLCFFNPVNISYNNPENPHWDILPNSVIVFPPNQTIGANYGGGITGSESFTVNGTTITISPISQPWNRGSNFLKLWYEPPFFVHPFFNVNTSTFQCANSTGGLPSITTFDFINATFLASLNFTFPSNTMSMYVDVRKCPATPIQYTPPAYCLLAGGQACYGSCSVEPLGNYFIVIVDTTNGSVVENYNDISIKENWTTIKIDVSNIINQDHNYRLVLGVQPPNGWLFDTNPYCSYFDNVRLFNQQFSSLDIICLDKFGKTCDQVTPDQKLQAEQIFCSPPQSCVGNDKYTNTLNNNGVCVSKIFTNDPTCVTQQQQQAVTGNQSIFLPISSVCNGQVNGNQTLCQSLQASGWGFLLIFITPIFWLMLFVGGMMVVATYLSKHMEIGIGIGVLMMIALATVFFELVWITIVFILIGGLIAGKYIVKVVSGGG
jgi:hypothetical protein